jgi:predicted NAD/FAD-binding protein
MLCDWRRFNREAQALIGLNGTAPSLGQWLEQRGFSRHFIERLIVPQASAVWSADPEQMWSFPASFMAEFFDNHGMFSLRDRPRWRTVSGGSIRYVEAISRPWRERIRTQAPVRRIDPGKMLRSFTYEHPAYTAEGVAAQARHDEVSGVRRTHYCGAYWGWGFHEDGVVSAMRACERIGVSPALSKALAA